MEDFHFFLSGDYLHPTRRNITAEEICAGKFVRGDVRIIIHVMNDYPYISPTLSEDKIKDLIRPLAKGLGTFTLKITTMIVDLVKEKVTYEDSTVGLYLNEPLFIGNIRRLAYEEEQAA